MANIFLLASDNSPDLLPLLRENPSLASSQDEHGYSLIHAAVSYNHLDLLRTLVIEFKVYVDLKDEDNETALFVVETVEAAKTLIELGADPLHKGSEGLTARERIDTEAEFPTIAAYLATIESDSNILKTAENAIPEAIPPPPEGLKVTMGIMDAAEDIPDAPDSEFRRRIEELSQRDDFNTPEGQEELRMLVEDAVLGQLSEECNVRSKQE